MISVAPMFFFRFDGVAPGLQGALVELAEDELLGEVLVPIVTVDLPLRARAQRPPTCSTAPACCSTNRLLVAPRCDGCRGGELHPHALNLAAAQGEGGMTDAHDERIAPRARLGQDLHRLAGDEAEFQQAPLERRQRCGARADTDDAAARAGRERGEAHER